MLASSTTDLAAFSQDSLLLPNNSTTLYMLSGIEASFGLCAKRYASAVEKVSDFLRSGPTGAPGFPSGIGESPQQ